MGTRVIDSDYEGEIGVVLFNHSAEDFQVQVRHRIAPLILKKIKTPTIQKVIALSATDRDIGAFGSTGLQSNGPSVSVEQKKNGDEKVKSYKERV